MNATVKTIRSSKDVIVGSVVTCTSKEWVDVTVGREYTIIGIGYNIFYIKDDAGDDRGVPEEHFKDWQLVVKETPPTTTTFTLKQNLLFTHEQDIMNAWTILDDLGMVARSWEDMSDDERKGVIEGIGLLGNLKMVKLQKSFEEVFAATIGE